MELSKILAITGKPGLYKVLAETKTGFVVESLIDNKRFPVFAHERVSSLEEISIFSTGEEDIHLKEVFKMMFEKLEGKPGPDPKGNPEVLKAFFDQNIPGYDPERVYHSDMKKVISWYNLLLEKQILDFTEKAPEEAEKKEEPEKKAGPEVGETPETKIETKPKTKKTKSR